MDENNGARPHTRSRVSEQEILERWMHDKPLYEAWARFIGQEIERRLIPVISPSALNYFLKVPMVPRLKGDASLIDKALHRNKSYTNPYSDITDKVGMRYVVLLTTHISFICSIIENDDFKEIWSWSKDKDYEAEREAKPLEFSYQSVHYVVKSKIGNTIGGIEIPEGLACEVQIRTLLQHAHSELTHDTLYKPKTVAKSSTKRTVAKSMALIEATDEFFAQAMTDLAAASDPQSKILDELSAIYFDGTGIVPGRERSNQIVIDAFMDVLPVDLIQKLVGLLARKKYIFDKIKLQADRRHFLGSQPYFLHIFWRIKLLLKLKIIGPLIVIAWLRCLVI